MATFSSRSLAAVVAGVACAAAAASGAKKSPVCPDDFDELTTSDVRDLLSRWNLAKPLGAEFEEQGVDGFALQHIRPETVNPVAYPNAQPFHWEILWARLSQCGGTRGTTVEAEVEAVLPSEQRSVPPRRRLAEASSSDVASTPTGIRLRSNRSSLSFGPDSDVVLRREGEETLGVDADLLFCDGHGLRFCNEEGDAPLITADSQGNVYISGNVHFLSNATFRGLELESFVKNVYADITLEAETEKERQAGTRGCAAILAVNSSATDGVYDVDGQYVYCDMSGGGWSLLASYHSSYGYITDFRIGTPTVLGSGGSPPPTDQIWAPLPNDDYGHVNMTAFDLSGNRTLKATCSIGNSVYSFNTTLFPSWTGGVYGNYAGTIEGEEVGWTVLSATDVGLKGRSSHFICGSYDDPNYEGLGFCSGSPASASWTPHMASVSFWPTTYIGCNGVQGNNFQLWAL